MDRLVGTLKSFLPELVLVLLMAVLLLLNIGAFEIEPYSEFFHIQSARESLFMGHFWVPVINGHDYLLRGPLWTWIVMGFFKLMGTTILAARIPAVICSLLSLAFTYMIAMELTQSRFSSLFAAAALASTWGYFHGSSLSTADIFTTVLYTAFCWAFLQWQSFASRKTTIPLEMNIYSAGMGVLLGLLLLTKSSMTVLMLIVIAVAYLIIQQRIGTLRKLNFSLFIAPLVLIPLPWLVIASIQSGKSHFIWDYLMQQPLDRMMGAGVWAGLHPDLLFYLKRLPLDFLPYWLMLPAIVLDSGIVGPRGGNAQPQEWTIWLLLWFGLGLVLNSFTVFHEPTRMLPFMPPVAILVGNYLGRVAESKAPVDAYNNTLVAYIGLFMLSAVLCAVIIFQVVPSDYVTGYWHLPGQPVVESLKLGKHLIDLPEAFPLWKFWMIPGPFILLIGGFMLYLLQSERRLQLTPVTLLSSIFAFLLFIKLLYMPIMYRPMPEAFAKQLNRQAQAGDDIVLYTLQPDIKRVLFYLDVKKLAHVRTVQKPELIEQNVIPPNGVVYGLMPEKSYFEDLPVADRSLLQVTRFDWNWNTASLDELKKFLVIRQPQFDLMKSKLISFQSLPIAAQQALRDVNQAEALLAGEEQENSSHSKKHKRR